MPNFQKIIDQLQDIVTRYPMKMFFYVCLLSAFPCGISYLFGGSVWARVVNLGIVEFSYGAVPIFLFVSWATCLPIAMYIKAENLSRRIQDEERQLLIGQLKAERQLRMMRARSSHWKTPG